MTDLVSRIFIPGSKPPRQSGNGLALFCAFVCVCTCCYSLYTTSVMDDQPTSEFYEMAAELRSRVHDQHDPILLEARQKSFTASHRGHDEGLTD